MQGLPHSSMLHALVGNKIPVSVANKPFEAIDKPRKTKIVATLGPSCWTDDMIPKMILAGVNIFRLNCSHRRGGDFERVYPLIRRIAAAMNVEIQVLGDLQGPKFRVGELLDNHPITICDGDILEFGIATDESDRIRPGRITMFNTREQVALMQGLFEGASLLVDDGLIELKVIQVKSPTEVVVNVVSGGIVRSRKGVNVPDVMIDCSALPEKDVEDAEYLLSLEPPIDFISISFVQKGSDIQELIDIMDRMNVPREKRPNLCPKIEKPQALNNLDEIMALSGSLMIARGDLGVELGHAKVPFAQKLIIAASKKQGLYPVIVATQMMESMISHPVPTRAECSDVANAVFDGTDATMLSGEAATGNYPCETVKMMAQVIREAEAAIEIIQAARKQAE